MTCGRRSIPRSTASRRHQAPQENSCRCRADFAVCKRTASCRKLVPGQLLFDPKIPVEIGSGMACSRQLSKIAHGMAVMARLNEEQLQKSPALVGKTLGCNFSRRLPKADNCLLQLRVNFIGYGHYVQKQ